MSQDEQEKRLTPPSEDLGKGFHVSLEDVERLAAQSLDPDFLRMLIEESNRTFFLIDKNTQLLVYISPNFENLWGIPRSEFYNDGNRWIQTVHPDDREICNNAAITRMSRPDLTYPPFEYRIHRPSGEIRWIRGNVFECQHAKTGVSLLCGISEDVTELKNNEFAAAQARADLEEMVRQRTKELSEKNAALQDEIARRAEVEVELLTKQAFLEKTLHTQEWERKLVAFEIHDCTIQNLVASRMHLDAVMASKLTQQQQKKLASSAELLRTAVDESRRVINGMRPQTLDVLGLRAAIDELLARHEIDGLQVAFEYDLAGGRISPMIETTLYRLLQEALTNVHRHAHVPTAQLSIHRDGDCVVFCVADQGRGFDPAATEEKEFGLHGLRQRAKSVGGEVTVDAAPNRGVKVTVRLPLLDPLDAAKHERDFAAAALERSRARLEQIIDKTSAVIFVKDYEGRYELVNHEHERMFRLKPGEIIGKTDFDFMPKEVAETVTENDRQAVRSPLPIIFEETVPEEGVMRDFVTVKFALPGEPGKPPSVCGIATDITEQKKQIRKLEEARHQFQTFMDHSPVLAWIKDSDFRYVFMNRRMLEIFDLTPEKAYGRTDLELFPERWAAPVHEHDVEVLKTGATHRYREECPVGDSEPLAWEACKFRLRLGDGSYQIAGVAVDVSGSVPELHYGLPRQ